MNIKKILFWVGIGTFGLFVLVALIRMPYVIEAKKTEELVAEIHATKLTLADVMGEDLPSHPGEVADATVAGVDENKNGIRDDVELAIFAEYPDLAKTRAALLQYALALQMQMTLPVVNTETVTATVEDIDNRALKCIWSLSSRGDMDRFIEETERNEKFVENLQINTEERRNYKDEFYKYLRSFSSSKGGCDIDLSTLTN